jgi:hypothetical protein
MHTPLPTLTVPPTDTDIGHAPPDPATGRDASGRFARGNPGGPGNPYYRRQAKLKRALLESITEDDVRSVVQVLLGLARTGDLAAIKLYLHYAAGKPDKDVDPDREELHEWELQKQSPPLDQVMGLMTQGIPTATANQRVRATMPIVADCNLKRLSQSILDGRDFQGEPIAPSLEEAAPQTVRDGGKRPSASARRMAAGVRPAEETGDNGGEDERAFDEMADEELAAAVRTGDIGALLAALQARSGGETGPGERDRLRRD